MTEQDSYLQDMGMELLSRSWQDSNIQRCMDRSRQLVRHCNNNSEDIQCIAMTFEVPPEDYTSQEDSRSLNCRILFQQDKH